MKRVLLADDSVAARKSIQTVLEVAGIDVVAVGNGDLALARLDDVAPEMVLLDAIMPGRSGYEVCAEIKANPAFERIPVLLITSEFEPYDEHLAEASLADGHLIKPLDIDAIGVMRGVFDRYAPAEAEELASVSEPPLAPSKPAPPKPSPESFITATSMRVADLEAAQAARLRASGEETVPAGTGGRASSWGAAVPDHFVDVTDAPVGVPSPLRRTPTTENLDAEGVEPPSPGAPDAVRSVAIEDLHSAGERCTACGAGLVSGDIFCLSCGAMVLVTSEEAKKLTRTQYCVECRQEVLPGEIFCVACGAVV